MAALMTSVIDNSSKLVQYIYDLKKMRVKLYPPDINEGFKHFRVVNSGIMFGLLAIKGVGSAMLDVIIKNREQHSKFRSLTDFIDRLAPFGVNKKILESLIKSGAMDSLGNNRRSHMESYQAILKTAQNNRNHVLKGQISLFTDNLAIENKIYYDSLSIFPEYDKNTLLAYEKEVLGIYTSGHPLSEYSDYIVKNATATSLDFLNAYEERSNIFDGKVVKVGGIIVERSIKYTKNDMVMAFINIEDLYGVIEVIVFPNVYERYKINLIDDKVVLVEGRVSMKEEDVRLICSKILLLPDSKQAIDKRLWIKIDKRSRISVNIIRDVLINFKGSTPVIIYDEHSNQKMSVNSDFWVDINDDGLLGKLTELLGPNCVALK
jgi:DNA polymerase-3 subunit alpha